MTLLDRPLAPVEFGALPGRGRRSTPVGTALFVASLGVLVQALGYAAGWAGHERIAVVGFYVGLVGIVLPYAVVLTMAGLTLRQRLSAAIAYGVLMYLSWFLTSPLLSTRFDESLHVATLVQLAEGHGFFQPNSMLPVSPHYPGLELMALAFSWLTGLPLIVCQMLTAMLGRIVLIAGLFLVAQRIGRSSRIGAVAVLLYSASTQFYFFNAQFSYQTIAIALVVSALALIMSAADLQMSQGEQARVPAQRRVAVALACLAALTITHHLTSWLMLGTLWALALGFGVGRERVRARLLLIAALAMTVMVGLWSAAIAPMLAGYLGPVFTTAGDQVAGLLQLDGGQREVGADSSGTVTPAWQMGLMMASMILWLVLLAPAALAMWRRRTIVVSRSRWLVILTASVYPALLAVRSSPNAAEVADRASTFVAMSMAIAIALWLHARLDRWRDLVVPTALVLVIGGLILGGGPDWQRVPGPYIPGAQQRSVDSQVVALGRWAGRYLPAGSRITSDLNIERMLPDFADVTSVSQIGGDENLTPIYTARSVTTEVISMLRRNDVDFVIVDLRIIDHAVRSGGYYEAGDAFGASANDPDATQLNKFDGAPGFQLVLDDGPIRVYDVRDLRGEPSTFTDRPDPGMPGQMDWRRMALALICLGALLVAGRRYLDPRGWGAGHLVASAAVIPGLMVVGAIGACVGATWWVGALVMVEATVLGLRALRIAARRAPLPPVRSARPGSRTWPAASALLLGTATAIAVLAQWNALTATPVAPAPTHHLSAWAPDAESATP